MTPTHFIAMNLRKIIIPSLLSVAGVAGAALLLMSPPRSATDGHEEASAEEPRGPHRGRLLQDGDFTLELAIFEAGTPPEFRAWFSKAGRPVPPADVRLSVTLIRPDKVEESFSFTPRDDFARGDHPVAEPHSFDYVIVAEHAGKARRWSFAAPEMRTTIEAATAEKSGIRVGRSGPAELPEVIEVYGRVGLDLDGVRRVGARFSGTVLEARKSLGEAVAEGEVLARVENTQTLVSAEVRSPSAGAVIARGAAVGETVAEGALLYTVARLDRVWAELELPRDVAARIRPGQSALVRDQEGASATEVTVTSVSPLVTAESQTALAKAVLPNPEGRWRPGAFIKAAVTLRAVKAAVTVRADAVQTIDGRPVVFSRHGDVYQGRPVKLGRRSGEVVEVLEGLKAGETYVTEGSFLIKADIGKSGASHDH